MKFKLAVDDCKKIYNALPIPLGDGVGENEPVFEDGLVMFNGAVHSESLCRVDVAGYRERNDEGVDNEER